jgi:DNA polymerase-3 subunit beta
MKISGARGDILDALSVVNRGLSSRSTLPILSSVLLSASGDSLTLQSTDLEVSVRHRMSVKVDDEGSCVIPGKLLLDIVRSLPEAAVTIDASNKDRAQITAEHASFEVRTLHAEDFPKFPEVQPDRAVDLPVETVAEAVKQVARSASRDETRPVLTGVLMVVDTGRLRMVATDSYRLAVREVSLDEPIEDFEIVVPSKAVEEIPRLAAGQERFKLGIAENQVVFEAGETTYVSRRIEGKFPNYKQLVPSEAETTVKIDRGEFLESVKRVSLLAQQNAPLRVAIDPAEATMTLTASTPDVGDAQEALMVEAEGEKVEIAFNAAFLAEGLQAAQEETVAVEVTTPLKPGVLRSIGGEEFIYILMPVRIG